MANNKSPARIYIAGDQPIFREALVKLLKQEPVVHVIGHSGNGKEILQLVVQHKPDILLIDPVKLKNSGMEVLKSLKEKQSGVKTIILNDSAIREEMADFFELGAHGVVAKESSSSLLFDGIKAVISGKYWIGNKAVSRPGEKLKKYPKSVKANATNNYGLTPREMDVMKAVVSGFTNKEIAKKLIISEQTVKHHITNIFDKLGVYNRLELTLFVFHHGLVEN